MSSILYHLRVVFACMKKEVRTSLAEPLGTLMGVFLPVNFLILLSFLTLAGDLAPIAVVMNESGPYARAFYQALSASQSFRLHMAGRQEAQDLLATGRIVAVVIIPADFDARLWANQPVQIEVEINNLNTDFTNDIRRAVPLSITTFYGKTLPHLVTITPHEQDFYAQDTGYLPYLSVSFLVLALMLGGLLQAGLPAAREWEDATIKELLLSPASLFAITVGKLLGALVTGLVSVVLVLLIIMLVFGIWPVHFWEMVGSTLLIMVVFLAFGMLLGTLLKQRQACSALALGTTIPLFFLSGAFGPISFNPGLIQVIAQLFPVYYAIVLVQHAFHGFVLNSYGTGSNQAILCRYAAVLLVLAALAFRRSTRVK